MNPQKAALTLIHDSGSAAGISPRTIASLVRKNQIQESESGYTLTKRGISRLEGRLGNVANLERQISMMRDSKKATAKRAGGKKIARSRSTQAKDRKDHEAGLGAYNARLKAATDRAMFRVLGGRDKAEAMKISKASGDLFTSTDVDGLESAGWKVTGAGTAPARPATGALSGHQDVFVNPAALGPMGTARALIVLGHVDAGTIHAFRRAGYDVSPAPKALRDPEIHRNPSLGKLAGLTKKLYTLIRDTAKAGQAWNGEELANKLGVSFSEIDHLLLDLAGSGLIHSPGADMFGSTWTAGAKQPGLFSNPGYGSHTKSEEAAIKRSAEKALNWYGKNGLVNATKVLRGFEFPQSFVDAGTIAAIEYESDKFDGKERLFRHDVTQKRRMLISADGSTIIVWPPFKITKRGIEG